MKRFLTSYFFSFSIVVIICLSLSKTMVAQFPTRQKISINEGWRFTKGNSSDGLSYDIRPEVTDRNDNKVADSKPTEAVAVKDTIAVLKKWILPTGNNFITDQTKHHIRPAGNPGSDFPYVQSNFNDAAWEQINLPHEWAIKEPFYQGANAEVGGGMGRLPSQGVAWYRRKLDITAADNGKTIYL